MKRKRTEGIVRNLPPDHPQSLDNPANEPALLELAAALGSAAADRDFARWQEARKSLIISNYDPLTDTVVFSNDRASWNVSRALRDCKAGKHKVYLIDVREAYEHNKACEVDEKKVRRFMRTPDVFKEPLLGVIEDGATWFIDGHHRLRALYRMRIPECACWIIEEADAFPYKVFYNGARLPPFKLD